MEELKRKTGNSRVGCAEFESSVNQRSLRMEAEEKTKSSKVEPWLSVMASAILSSKSLPPTLLSKHFPEFWLCH